MGLFNSNKWRVMKAAYAPTFPHRGRIAAGFICVILTNLFLLATPRVMGYAVDSLKESVTREKLAFYAALIVGLAGM